MRKRGNLRKKYTSRISRNPWVLLWELTIRGRKSVISACCAIWTSTGEINNNWCWSFQKAIGSRWYITSFSVSRLSKVLWCNYRAQRQSWSWNCHWSGACNSRSEKINWTWTLNRRSWQPGGRRRFTFRKESNYLSDTYKGRDFINSDIANHIWLPCNSQSHANWPMCVWHGFGVYMLNFPSTKQNKKGWMKNELAFSAWRSEHIPGLLVEIAWAKFLINLHGARAEVKSRSNSYRTALWYVFLFVSPTSTPTVQFHLKTFCRCTLSNYTLC